MTEKINIIILDKNEEDKNNILSFFKKYNFDILATDSPQEALQSYTKVKPAIFIIDPFFVVQKVQGVDILIQLKNNNSLLEKPVTFIGISNINVSTKKILETYCDFYCDKKKLTELDKIITKILGGETLKKFYNEEVMVSSMISPHPLKKLVEDIKYDGLNGYLDIIDKYITITNKTQKLTEDEVNDKRILHSKLIKGFWKLYLEVAKRLTVDKVKNLETIIFLRFRALLEEDWISPTVINFLIKFVTNTLKKKTQSDVVFYADEWMSKLYEGEIVPTYNDILVQEFRRQKDYFPLLKALRTNKEENYYNTISRYLGVIHFENEKKKNKNKGKFYRPSLEEITEKGKELLFENEIIEMFKALTNTCIGAQGNKVPIMKIDSNDDISHIVVKKEQVLKIMNEIEKIDRGLYTRVRLGLDKKFQEYRVLPYVILVPCSARRGICWDPWHDSNKRTSPGRIAIPVIIESNLYDVVFSALGSLRWRTAKQVADIYWMEEGLTGMYYQYWELFKKKIFTDTGEPYVSSKNSVEESFILDYRKWIDFESKGQLKLRKEVREIFWFNIPFSENIKSRLRGRGQIYEELLMKDNRRKKSRFTAGK